MVSTINAYKNSAAQFKVNGLPLVSTFEGPDDSGDWPSIRSQVDGIFFLPDWISQGAVLFIKSFYRAWRFQLGHMASRCYRHHNHFLSSLVRGGPAESLHDASITLVLYHPSP